MAEDERPPGMYRDRRGEWEQRLRTGLIVAFETGAKDFANWSSDEVDDIVGTAVAFIMELTHDEADDSHEVLALKLRLAEAQRLQAEDTARTLGDRLQRIKAAFDEVFHA